MRLNGHLADLLNNADEYGEWRYHLTVMGVPSDTAPWGWQLDGHHLIVNYFVLGDQVVMTPSFMGIRAGDGNDRTIRGRRRCCRPKNERGSRSCARSRRISGRPRRFRPRRRPTTRSRQAFRDNLVLDYAGLPGRKLTARAA